MTERMQMQNEVELSPFTEQYHWNGWGFRDTSLTFDKNGDVTVEGTRYPFSGECFPNFRPFIEEEVKVNVMDESPSQTHAEACATVPPPVLNEAFLRAIDGHYRMCSFSNAERLHHAHGHTAQEIYELRFGKFERVPDLVVWPRSHDDVERLVQAAHEFDVVLVPYGGGTSVTHAIECPRGETRMIVSLDMHAMNRVLWVSRQNLTACIEAGAVGKDIERKLRAMGLTMGHEPDSSELSTMGGWVATRASGMKKNKYGNIEDMLVQAKFVTPRGTVCKPCQGPRTSTGPDVHHMIMGSEGTLGVVTECVVKVHPLPAAERYGSVLFPDFACGVAFMHAVSRQMRTDKPVSIRLMDNPQFHMGHSFKAPVDSRMKAAIDALKKWYVTQRLHFDPNQMVACTLKFEGDEDEVAAQEKKVLELAKQFGGLSGGAENGARGYFLTFMIAYIRDFGMGFHFIAESFETSVPWQQVHTLCNAVKKRIVESCAANGVKSPPFASCRVTQTYDAGACCYFYFGFSFKGLEDPIGIFSQVEADARDEVLKQGGSLSHHHGVGKVRKQWMSETITPTGIAMLQGVKRAVDPRNVFANANLFDVQPVSSL